MRPESTTPTTDSRAAADTSAALQAVVGTVPVAPAPEEPVDIRDRFKIQVPPDPVQPVPAADTLESEPDVVLDTPAPESLTPGESLKPEDPKTAGALKDRFSPFHFNKPAFLITGAALAVITLIGLGSVLLANGHKNGANSVNIRGAGNYTVGSNLQLNAVKSDDGQLQVGQASQLTINGRLQVSNTLVIEPTKAPASPTIGQIYYDRAANAPYYYNGTQFVSLAPHGVTSLGGADGALGLGTGLSITGSQLSISSTLLQQVNAVGGPHVDSLQGQTGNVTLAAGPGIGINGTTISNAGLISLASGSGNLVIGNDGAGHYTVTDTNAGGTVTSITGTANQINASSSTGNVVLSLPQDIAISSSPTFAGLNLGTPGSVTGNLNFANNSSNQQVILQALDPTGVGNATVQLPSMPGGTTDSICLVALGNCAGSGGGIIGAGTAGSIPKFTSGNTIADSNLSESGSLLTYSGSLIVNAANGFSGNLVNLEVNNSSKLSVDQNGNSIQAGTLTVNGTGASSVAGSLSVGTGLSVTTGGATIAGNSTITGTLTGLTGLTSAGTITFSGLNTSGVVHTNGSGVLSTSPVVLGSDTSGDYIASLGSLTGLITTGNGGAGSTPTLSVNYGVLSNTAVQGNTTLTVAAGTGLSGGGTITLGAGGTATLDVQYGSASGTAVEGDTTLGCASGTGNLSGGGNSVTLGAGGSCNDISITSSPTFTGTLTVQGSGGVVVGVSGITNGVLKLANSTNSNLASLQSAALGQATTYNLPDPGAGSVDICLSSGNCAGSGGGIVGSGTAGHITKFSGSGSVTDSNLTESGSTLTYSGNVVIQGTNSLALGTASGNNGALIFNNSTNGNTLTLQAGATASNLALTLPTADGSPGYCLMTNGSGILSFQGCTGGAGGGVTSIDGQIGVVTLNNSSGSLGIITIDNASTTQKGIAQFNSTNFSASSGTINTIQDIASSSSPTFNGLTLSNALTVANGGTGTGSFTANGILYGNGTSAIQATTAAADSILATNGSNVPGLTQTLPVAVQSNISTVGTLTSGSIGSGFSTISTGNLISTTSSLHGNTLSVGSSNQFQVDASGNATTTGTLAVQGAGGLTLGVANSVAGKLTFASSSTANLSILQSAAPSGSGNATYVLPTIAGSSSDTVCLVLLGNCSTGVTGSGSNGTIALFTGASSIGNSILTQAGTTLTAAGNLVVNAANGFSGNLINLEVNSSSKLSVDQAGNSTQAGTLTVNGTGASSVAGSLSVGTGLTVNAGGANVTGDINTSTLYKIGGNTVLQTPGTGNTFVGGAGNGSVSGTANTAVGGAALQAISSGYSNSAFGQNAMAADLSGVYNASFGNSSLRYNTTGNYNAVLGAGAGTGINGGSDITGNSLLGYNSGNLLQTGGNYNTLLGYGAGGNLTTGAHNVIIGDNVNAVSATGSYQLNIANAIYGDLSVGSVTFKNGTNSTNAFQIQNAGGTNLLVADTLNSTVSVNNGTLQVANISVPGVPTLAAGANTGGSLSGASSTTYYYQVTAITTAGESPPTGEQSFNGGLFTPLTPPSSALASADSGSGSGTTSCDGAAGCTYVVTFVSANGETTAGPSSAPLLNISGHTINLTSIPTGPTGTVARNIYLSSVSYWGGTSTYRKIITINDNVTTSTTDTGSNPAGGSALSTANINTATTNTNNLSLNWTAVAGATGYKVYRGTSSGGENTLVGSPGTNSFTDTGGGSGGTPPSPTATPTLNVTGAQIIKPASNVTNAFQVQNAGGTNLLQVNSTTASFTFGTANTAGTAGTSGTSGTPGYPTGSGGGSVGTWTAGTSLGTGCGSAVYGGASVAYNGYLYEIGGNNGSGVTTNTCYASLNPTTGAVGSWTAASHAATGRYFASAVVNNGYIYVIGGTSNGTIDQTTVRYALLCTSYNSGQGGCTGTPGDIGTWASINPLPTPIEQHTSVVNNGYVYVLGGISGGAAGTPQSNVYYALFCTGSNSGTDGCSSTAGTVGTWHTISGPTALVGAASSVNNGYIFMAGGNASSGACGVANSASVYSAQINTNGTLGAWGSSGTMGWARYGGFATSWGGYMYYLGGNTDGGSCITASYEQNWGQYSGGSTTGWNYNTGPYGGWYVTGTSYNGYLYQMGGTDGSSTLSTVQYASVTGTETLTGGTAGTAGTPGTAGTTGLGVSLTLNGTALFQNTVNGASAFQIQDASGNSLFTANTSQSTLTVASLLPQTASSGSLSVPTSTNVDTGGLVNNETSIAIGQDGFARMTYYDGTNGDLKFIQCTNSTCSTNTPTTIDSTNSVGRYNSIAIGADGLPRISYYDATNGDLKFVQCANAACSSNTITTVDSTGTVGQYTSLAMGPDGFARISYYDATNTNLKFAQCTNAACSTSNISTVDGASSTAGQYSSLAVGSDGFGRISYRDNTSGLKFAQCTNAACSTSTTNVVDSSTAVPYDSLVLGTDGFARISYRASGFLKFAQCTNAACSTSNLSTVDNSNASTGFYTAIALGSDGLPRIAYQNESGNGSLNYAQCTNAACSTSYIATIDNNTNNGYFNSIAVSSGFAYIAYDDLTLGYLKMARLPTGTAASSIGSTGSPFGSVSTTSLNAGSLSVDQFGQTTIKSTANSTTAFQVQNSSGTTVFDVNTTNQRVGIGTSAPSYTFSVTASASATQVASIINTSATDSTNNEVLRLGVGAASTTTNARFIQFYGGTTTEATVGTAVGHININNNAVNYATSGADYAEWFNTTEPVSVGDIVKYSGSGVGKAQAGNTNIVGVVSDSYGFTGGYKEGDEANPDRAAIGLMGQVSVKVTGDPIAPGDPVGISATPGVGQKMNGPGEIIGYAEESFAGGTGGTIKIYLSPGYYNGPDPVDYIQSGGNAILNDLNVGGVANLANLNVSGVAHVNDLQVTGTASINDLTVTGSATVATLHVLGAAEFDGPTIKFSDNVRGINLPIGISATSVPIIFGTPHTDADYAVQCTPSYNTTCYVTAKTANGFTVNFGAPPPDDKQTVDWFVVR